MKKLKRTLSLAIAALLLAGTMAGCNKAVESSSSTPASTPVDGASETPGVAGMEGWEPFADKVRITVPVYDRAQEGSDPVDDNYWTRWIQSEFGDKWNIEVQYVAIPRNDVMTKYSMLIADKQTPTILMEYDYPKVTQWASDGAMQTIDIDAFAQVAPTYYQSMVDNDQLGYTDINGESYFILSERPYYEIGFTSANFVRMDWLREVGYDHVPMNYEEFTDAMNKIVEAGLCDNPYNLGVPTAAYVTNFSFRDYPENELEWAMHSSLGTPSLSYEPTRRYLQRLNEMYNNGWIKSEFDLDDDSRGGSSDQIQTDFINGNLYRYGGYISANMSWLEAFYENNPDAELAIENPWYLVDGELSQYPLQRANNPFGMIIGFSSFASDDEVKAAWMLMEWMIQEENLFTLENGIEGVTFNYDDNGVPIIIADYDGEERLGYNMNIDYACLVHASKKIGTVEQTIVSMAPQGLPQDFTDALLDQYDWLVEIADKGWSYTDPIFAVDIESEAEYKGTLLSVYQEAFVKLVKCDPADFEALYEEWSQKFLDAGYQEVIDERKEAYENGMTTKLPWNYG